MAGPDVVSVADAAGVEGRHARVVAEGFRFPECPRWHDGRLYFSDFYGKTVYVVGDDEVAVALCAVENRPGGLGFTTDGQLLIASQADRRILRLTEDGRLVHAADVSAMSKPPLNDMLVDYRGRAYIGTIGSDIRVGEPIVGCELLLVDTDGSVSVIADDLILPNGIALSQDGKSLYVSESFGFAIWQFDVDEAGRVSNRREFVRFRERLPRPTMEGLVATGAIIPDGICLDEEGALWVGSPAGGGALRIKDGEIVDRVDTGELVAVAPVLGGPDRRTLYLCAGPKHLGELKHAGEAAESFILACEVDVAGAGLP
jgi:sugar lactone lactonase YvrE